MAVLWLEFGSSFGPKDFLQRNPSHRRARAAFHLGYVVKIVAHFYAAECAIFWARC